MKSSIDRKIQEAFKALPDTGNAEKEISELRPKLELLNRELVNNSVYVKTNDAIKLLLQKTRDFENEIQDSPRLAAMRVKVEIFQEKMRLIEEKVAQRPAITDLKDSIEKQYDEKKKKELHARYLELLKTERVIDPAWQTAFIASQRTERQHQELLRREVQAHTGRAKANDRIAKLREEQKALLMRLKASNRELAELEEVVRGKQEALNLQRQEFERTEKVRLKARYTKAAETLAAARKAVDDQRKRLDQSAQMTELLSRIDSLKKEKSVLRIKFLKDAKLAGRNPYPGADAAKLWNFQQNMVYHKSADWNDRTKEEVADKVTPRLKEWLLRVRGY